uniref:Uncharacterized protein n=1 Tax=Arundo donax TaxID=35708 RepID=A0A0A9C242_ARUDO
MMKCETWFEEELLETICLISVWTFNDEN